MHLLWWYILPLYVQSVFTLNLNQISNQQLDVLVWNFLNENKKDNLVLHKYYRNYVPFWISVSFLYFLDELVSYQKGPRD
jgi:hypothetical protein